MKLLIKGGTCLDPGRIHERCDLLLDNGVIAAIGADLPAEQCQVVDATGCLVVPGLIDMHVHLREPGYEWKETIASGTRAAAVGGFTAVACMPNTDPVLDNGVQVEWVLEKAKRTAVVWVYPIGAITKGRQGKEIAGMGEMKDAGAVAFSDDGDAVQNAEVMRCGMVYAGMFSVPVISHCLDPDLAGNGVVNFGRISTLLGLAGIPAAAEEVMVARDIILAELTGTPLHIAHLSTAGAVEMVRQAKRRGLPVTAEVTPHHLVLTEEAVYQSQYDTNTKVNPPLRSERDRQALIAGLNDGTIDVIASDHAPHHQDEKQVEYDRAAFGMVGLETTVPVILDKLVQEGLLPLERAITCLTANPARILGVPGGTLAVGSPADVTVIDLQREQRVDPQGFYSLSSNTPFAGWSLKGWPAATIVGGRLAAQAGEIVL
jgi:dihydroorotase